VRGRTNLVRALAAALVAVLLSAAPAAGLPTADDTKACDLLKRSEIKDVVGQNAGKAEELGVGDSSCFWELADADGGGLVLTVFRGRGAKANYDKGKESYQPSDVTEVAGLGKEAFTTPLGEIWVVKGRKTVFFITGVFDAAQSQQLATTVLDRL
jgi:hypothetical protein